MRIILIRHFKVDYKWKFWYDSETYRKARIGYDEAAVIKTDLNVEALDWLITSTMGRTLETSQHIFGRTPDLREEVLREVPIEPFLHTRFRLPKIVWDVIGRIQWRLNLKSQPETFNESKKRVNAFLEKLISENRNVIIICHGWIMKLMIPRLRQLGFIGPNPLYIKNGLPYEYVKS